MGRKCFVKNCTSDSYTSQNISIFGTPKDKQRLEKWISVVPAKKRKLNEKDYVCEKHFDARYIEIKRNFFAEITLKRLAKNAIPTKFARDNEGTFYNDMEIIGITEDICMKKETTETADPHPQERMENTDTSVSVMKEVPTDKEKMEQTDPLSVVNKEDTGMEKVEYTVTYLSVVKEEADDKFTGESDMLPSVMKEEKTDEMKESDLPNPPNLIAVKREDNSDEIEESVLPDPSHRIAVKIEDNSDEMESDLPSPLNHIAVKIEDNCDEEEELPKPAAITLQVMHDEDPGQERTSGVLTASSSSPVRRRQTYTGWCQAPSNDQNKYECDMCGVVLSAASSIRKHKIAVHLHLRPYQCDICSATFTQEANLNRHKRNHSGERPFQCDVCSVAFTQKVNLKKHMRLHTSEFPNQSVLTHVVSAENEKLRLVNVPTLVTCAPLLVSRKSNLT